MSFMQDIHQSALYGQFMRRIGWAVETIDGVNIFIKPFPLVGATIKIQRTDKVPNIDKLQLLAKKYHTRFISFEPSLDYKLRTTNYELSKSPYLPTKTVHIDLTASAETILKRFSEAKRRAVRRAQKEQVAVEIGNNIDAFIQLKSRSAGFMGFLTTTTLKPLFTTFTPTNQTTVLLAYLRHSERSEESLTNARISNKLRDPSLALRMTENNPVAGILLLWHNHISYYWIAAATITGKKAFAPTLLVWEALKFAKKNGCTLFDFEGIYDERYPNLNKNWLGFTKFKQGFGGKETYFPQPFII